MPFGKTADGGVAAHDRDVVEVDGQEKGGMAHARCCKRCFATCVTGTHDDHVICFVVNGHRWKKGTRPEVKGAREKQFDQTLVPCTEDLVPLSIPAVSSRESKPRLSSRARERISQYDGFFPTGAHRDNGERNPYPLFDPLEIIPGGSRKIIPLPGGSDVFVPPWKLLIDRNASGKSLETGGHGFDSFSVQLIGNAYLQGLQAGEHVELCHA